MDLLEAIRRFRSSETKFRSDAISPDHIKLLIEAAARSPSHFNSQPWRFVFIRDPEKIAALTHIESPLVLAIAMNKDEYKPGELAGLYSTISLGAVIQTFWLVTESLNIGMFPENMQLEDPERKRRISEQLRIPENYELVVLFRLGYKVAESDAELRAEVAARKFEDLASAETWNNPLPAERRNAQSLFKSGSE
jgi:nitroreductase